MTMTQAEALAWYVRKYPGASSLEITHDLSIVNVTGRVSDLRAKGVDIECYTRSDGVKGYRIVDKPQQLEMTL
jgi:biotin operon repressor